MKPPIRILVVDDHPFVQLGLRHYLESEPDMVIVGTASSGAEAQHWCDTVLPDVMVLDFYMPGSSTVGLIHHVKATTPATKILVCSAFHDAGAVQQVLTAGIAGYILKEESPQLLAAAIRTVMGGGTWFSRAVMDQIVKEEVSLTAGSPLHDLSEREREILTGIARGWSNAQIAAQLHLAEQTVRNYTGRIYVVLGVRSRTEAVLWAQTHGVGTTAEQ